MWNKSLLWVFGPLLYLRLGVSGLGLILLVAVYRFRVRVQYCLLRFHGF